MLSEPSELRANRISEAYVSDDAPAEEGRDASPGSIEELVWDDEVQGGVLLFE